MHSVLKDLLALISCGLCKNSQQDQYSFLRLGNESSRGERVLRTAAGRSTDSRDSDGPSAASANPTRLSIESTSSVEEQWISRFAQVQRDFNPRSTAQVQSTSSVHARPLPQSALPGPTIAQAHDVTGDEALARRLQDEETAAAALLFAADEDLARSLQQEEVTSQAQTAVQEAPLARNSRRANTRVEIQPSFRYRVKHALPTRVYVAGSMKDENNEQPQCSICLVEYEPGDSLRTLPCLHAFHKVCIDQWINSCSEMVCPACRRDIDIDVL
mmetsp:Transcript_155/g.297  ORF Transcript_155/g.297 Transcript_155/m.297 type:complete len:272 (+) Transcript_155:85-900(+)